MFIIFEKSNDLERMPKMKQKCGNCEYFESRGIISGSTNWGLCSKSTKEIRGNKESPFFRWEDDTCSNFEASDKSSDLQLRRNKAR
jgi:hypothetical protein